MDQAFRAQHAFECLQISNGDRQDDPTCSEVTACDQRPQDALWTHLCRAGLPNCTSNIPQLNHQLSVVLDQLKGALAPYADLIALDLDEVGTIEKLCSYALEEIETLQAQATSQRKNLNSYRDGVEMLKQCAAETERFMQGSKPPELTDQLWQDIAGLLIEPMKEFRKQEGIVETEIDKLDGAPRQIAGLRMAFNMACDLQTAQDADEGTQ